MGSIYAEHLSDVPQPETGVGGHTSAYVSRRQHTSAYRNMYIYAEHLSDVPQPETGICGLFRFRPICSAQAQHAVCGQRQYPYFCTSKASKASKLSTCVEQRAACRQRQYPYFCTSKASKASKASKLSTCVEQRAACGQRQVVHVGDAADIHAIYSAYVSIRPHTSAYVSIRRCCC